MKLSALVFVVVLCASCDRVGRAIDVLLEDPTAESASVDPAPNAAMQDPHDPGVPPAQNATGAVPFQIYDKGLSVVRSTVLLPAGWRGYQDIATNTNTGESERYVLDYYGPRGELIRAAPAGKYFGPMGQKFGPTWRQYVKQAMQGVGTDVRIGERRPTQMLERLPNINKMLGNMSKEAFEAPFTATREGKPMKGVAYVLHLPIGQGSGSFALSITVAPAEFIDEAVEAGWKIGASEQLSPAYLDAQNRMNQGLMAKSARDHQARMRRNQQAFDAHQARMKNQQAAFDQANAAWMDNFRGSGGSAGGDGYTGHDAFIDSIHETDTFRDPSTGHNVQRSGQFKYNYTDGQGNFYGTNDPSFEPAALQGDWQATEPLQP